MLKKVKDFYIKVKDVFIGSYRDIIQVLNESNTRKEFQKNSQKIIPENIQRVFGNRVKNTIIVLSFFIPLIVGGTAFIQNDFIMIKNIKFAISSDAVIENRIEEQEHIIRELEKEKAVLQAKNEQIEKQYNLLLDSLEKMNRSLDKKGNNLKDVLKNYSEKDGGT